MIILIRTASPGAADFPVLYKKPDVSIKEDTDDPTISSKMENGLDITRPRFTRMRRTWSVNYSHSPQSDKDTLVDFVRTVAVGGAAAFSWMDPRTDTVMPAVRFSRVPTYIDAGWVAQKNGVKGLSYNISFELREV